MAKIILEPVNNGVVKRVEDPNHGGGNTEWTSVNVYEKNSDELEFIKKFFYDICDDLGISTGNNFSQRVITIHDNWGIHYKPSKKELNDKIKKLQAEIEFLKEWEVK